jgi:hypothetical protein
MLHGMQKVADAAAPVHGRHWRDRRDRGRAIRRRAHRPTQVSVEACEVSDTHGQPETSQNAQITSLTLRPIARTAAQHLAAVDPCDEFVRQPCTAGERKK